MDGAKDQNLRHCAHSWHLLQRCKPRSTNRGNRHGPQVLPPAALSPSENLTAERALEGLSGPQLWNSGYSTLKGALRHCSLLPVFLLLLSIFI